MYFCWQQSVLFDCAAIDGFYYILGYRICQAKMVKQEARGMGGKKCIHLRRTIVWSEMTKAWTFDFIQDWEIVGQPFWKKGWCQWRSAVRHHGGPQFLDNNNGASWHLLQHGHFCGPPLSQAAFRELYYQ